MPPQLIAVGASLGGLLAISQLLQRLSPTFTIPVAIVQHRHFGSEGNLLEFLQCSTSLRIKEVEDKDKMTTGWVYLAPANYHLLVELGYFTLSVDEPVSFARPSIDVLFESAAEVYGPRAIGIVLTGANQDGATGAAALKAKGGTVIVQDPSTAESAVMPEAVLARKAANWVMPVDQMAEWLNRLSAQLIL